MIILDTKIHRAYISNAQICPFLNLFRNTRALDLRPDLNPSVPYREVKKETFSFYTQTKAIRNVYLAL